jgi:DNA phosphorothioation-associated putative methyltransferase
VPRLRKADVLFEEHQDLLQPLMDFYAARGRLADHSELPECPKLIDVFGSLKNAFRIISLVTDMVQWNQIREERSQDLLVYLALSRFDGRKKLSDLPRGLQLDIKAFFSSYKRACSLSDVLLFGCGNQEMIDKVCAGSPVGKLTQQRFMSMNLHLPNLSHNCEPMKAALSRTSG